MLIDEVIRLLNEITEEDIRQLAPAERRRLADRLKYLAQKTEEGLKPKGDKG